MTTSISSLYEALGGEASIDAAVEVFYRRVLADPELSPFFENVGMERQKRMLRSFLGAALGGPEVYGGRDMRSAHRKHGITDRHFDLVAGHLIDTLAELGVPAEIIDQVVAVVAPLRADVVQIPSA